ncbi:MAG: anaerobic ribonucleoside-triphosphate reductase activating protein, partial [Oscillospiraceae bacterium]|nr:anaerobic ribonucleoside-triphosphate reductase activating protein [Oscillospiraceae bacterium]
MARSAGVVVGDDAHIVPPKRATTMRIAGLVQDSIVDGPGFRFVVFAQGCTQQCEGCHNPHTWDTDGGTEMTVEEITAQMGSNPLTDGLTLSGGEPFLQALDCAALATAAREMGFNTWAYTGYTYEELAFRAAAEPEVGKLLEQIDVLIDGAFVLAERTLSLRWRGSRN